MKTSIMHGRFKRHETYFNGHSADTARGRITTLHQQPVRIVQPRDMDEDTWAIETFDGQRYIVDGDDLSPHPEAPETNTEFMERLMEGHTALAQAFILQAIEQYGKAVLAAPKKAPEDDNGFISDAAWRDCAAYVLGQFTARDAIKKGGE